MGESSLPLAREVEVETLYDEQWRGRGIEEGGLCGWDLWGLGGGFGAE